MDYHQKAAALSALSDFAIHYRDHQDRVGYIQPWYVSLKGVEIADGHTLTSPIGNGMTPEAAIDNIWNILTDALPPNHRLVIHARRPDRRAVRWNGFMWKEFKE